MTKSTGPQGHASNRSLVSEACVSLPVCLVSLPRLANSVGAVRAHGSGSCLRKKIEFASLPRFLSGGVSALGSGEVRPQRHPLSLADRQDGHDHLEVGVARPLPARPTAIVE